MSSSIAELESAFLASEERCRALENGREFHMATIDRIISALTLASARDATLAALDGIAPASGTDAMATKLDALVRAIASSLADGADEHLRRAHTAEVSTLTASTMGSESEVAASADARMSRSDAHAASAHFQPQHLHAQLEACEVSFESVRGVLCDCISQLDRPSSLSAVIRAA